MFNQPGTENTPFPFTQLSQASAHGLGEPEGELAVDVYQTEEAVVIKAAIAGVRQEDMEIFLSHDLVTIRGVRHRDEQVRKEDYFTQECYWGKFSRSVILPHEVNADRAEATLKNGLLTIRLPKRTKPQSITVTEIEDPHA